MQLEYWSKYLFNNKALFTAFLLTIYTAVIIFVMLPSANVSHVYMSGSLSRLLSHGKKQFDNISQGIYGASSNMADLTYLVAREKTQGDQISLKPCPAMPSGLVGKLNISILNLTESVTNEDSLRRVVYGGRYKPEDCIARERTAIIIPYRDREEHLDILTRHLHNILQRQQLEYRIFVIEMALPAQFNRGILANIGVITAKESDSFSCFIIHDVDLLMMNDANLYRCGNQPRHLVTGNTKYGTKNKEYGLPYEAYVSGVIALTYNQYRDANGFSNVYFGWGGEDDDFSVRVQRAGMKFVRPEKDVGIYMAMPHEKDRTNPINPARLGMLQAAAARNKIEGISSFDNNIQRIKYKRYSIEYRQYYTWVLVCVDEAAILKQFEKYLGESFAV